MAGFDGDTFLVREHVGMLKLTEAFDILTADGQTIAFAQEQASFLKKILKLILDRRMLPFQINILNPDQQVLLIVRRPFTFFRSKVVVSTADDQPIGYFQKRILSMSSFDVYDSADKQLATLKGDWKGWNFTFTDASGAVLGQVSKKWAGLAQELFTTADNYVVHIERSRITDVRHVQLMLAAALCIDCVLKE